jgi:glycine cleavage system T protein (aminomethyltransferase)
MSVGTAFHPRTASLNKKLEWREWAGFYAASVYADHHDIEYNAIREAAALIDVSPLFKYVVSGPDATRLVDRVIARDATKIKEGGVIYTCWCDEAGKVIDDGTVARLDETTYRWTAADPSYRWFKLNAAGLDVTIEEITETVAALALQGPRSRDVLEAATGESFADLRYFQRRPSAVSGIEIDVSRTGYTGDLGYELWIPAERAVDAWDHLMAAGAAHGLRPAGMLALDVARLEAGLILIEVDFFSSRHALIPEQAYSPFEIGLGRMVNFKKDDFVGKRALMAEQASGGPDRRLVGLELDWDGIARLYDRQGLPPAVPSAAWRSAVPVYSVAGQIGRATSGTWSPSLKKCIALGSVPPRYADEGTLLHVEWTVEARRDTVPAHVVPLPFFDPPRKKAVFSDSG